MKTALGCMAVICLWIVIICVGIAMQWTPKQWWHAVICVILCGIMANKAGIFKNE